MVSAAAALCHHTTDDTTDSDAAVRLLRVSRRSAPRPRRRAVPSLRLVLEHADLSRAVAVVVRWELPPTDHRGSLWGLWGLWGRLVASLARIARSAAAGARFAVAVAFATAHRPAAAAVAFATATAHRPAAAAAALAPALAVATAFATAVATAFAAAVAAAYATAFAPAVAFAVTDASGATVHWTSSSIIRIISIISIISIIRIISTISIISIISIITIPRRADVVRSALPRRVLLAATMMTLLADQRGDADFAHRKAAAPVRVIVVGPAAERPRHQPPRVVVVVHQQR